MRWRSSVWWGENKRSAGEITHSLGETTTRLGHPLPIRDDNHDSISEVAGPLVFGEGATGVRAGGVHRDQHAGAGARAGRKKTTRIALMVAIGINPRYMACLLQMSGLQKGDVRQRGMSDQMRSSGDPRCRRRSATRMFVGDLASSVSLNMSSMVDPS